MRAIVRIVARLIGVAFMVLAFVQWVTFDYPDANPFWPGAIFAPGVPSQVLNWGVVSVLAAVGWGFFTLGKLRLEDSRRSEVRSHPDGGAGGVPHSNKQSRTMVTPDDIKALITSKSDVFGFLPVDWSIQFNGGEIASLPDWNESRAMVEKLTNSKDGFIYPPTACTTTTNDLRRPPEEWERVPQSEKPGWDQVGFTIPVSHVLKLDHDPLGPFRSADGAFLMHLAGYLFGHWLQFYEWWLDRRIPMKSASDFDVSSVGRAEEFFSAAYDAWRGWPETTRRRFTNLLYMIARAHTYDWDWEKFLLYYMVIDGAYRTVRELGVIEREGAHSRRIKELCTVYGLHFDEGHVRKIVDLRNDLFHETLWDKSQPGSGVSDEAFYESYNVKRFALRLVPAIVGFTTDYVQSDWTSISRKRF